MYMIINICFVYDSLESLYFCKLCKECNVVYESHIIGFIYLALF